MALSVANSDQNSAWYNIGYVGGIKNAAYTAANSSAFVEDIEADMINVERDHIKAYHNGLQHYNPDHN